MDTIKHSYLVFMILVFVVNINAEKKNVIIVDHKGIGDYKTLAEAVNSLPMFNYERITIFIKNGIYEEKIRIDQDYITLEGESREGAIIQYNQLREDWNNNKDSIGPAVININGDDIIFKNLTVKNIQPEIGPHAFALYGTGTRTILLNCNMVSKGADTVSLWDYKTGMYYHANCYLEGAVDFVCPRGWCFIKDSQFYEVKETAAIWLAGGYDKDQKFVLKNCKFDGVPGFQLARHHYEAQFYLLGCNFSKNMSDKQIYRVTYEDTTRNRPFNWGEKYYYQNCTREGGNYSWMENNLEISGLNIAPEDITPEWTFDGKWNPESEDGPVIIDVIAYKDEILLKFDETLTVLGNPLLVSQSGKTFKYVSGAGSNTLKLRMNSSIEKGDIKGLKIVNEAKIIGNVASVKDRSTSFINVKQ